MIFMCVIGMLIPVCYSQKEHISKRLLLNSDPNYLQNQINTLKTEMADLKSKLLSEQAETSTLKSQMTSEQAIVADLTTNMASLQTVNKMLQDNIAKNKNEDRGVVYTRWGKTTCAGNGTELVYTGFGAGSGFSETGAGANYICLPAEPVWGHYNDNPDDYRGFVFGMEYEQIEFSPDIHNDNAPCAVCRVKTANTVLMIPGRNKCYNGWHTEYHGYLVSDYHKYSSSQFICLDAAPDVMYGGHNDEAGAVLYSVEGRCGPLPCPPYVNGRELTCVVCSK